MIKINSDLFGRQLDAAFEKKIVEPAKESIRIAVREVYAKLATEAGYGASSGSPVWFANFINNHKIEINGLDQSYNLIKFQDGGARPKPRKSLRPEDEAELANVKLGDKVNISNSVPYARDLEYYGSSRKTPYGIYRVTTAVVKMYVDKRMKAAFRIK